MLDAVREADGMLISHARLPRLGLRPDQERLDGLEGLRAGRAALPRGPRGRLHRRRRRLAGLRHGALRAAHHRPRPARLADPARPDAQPLSGKLFDDAGATATTAPPARSRCWPRRWSTSQGDARRQSSRRRPCSYMSIGRHPPRLRERPAAGVRPCPARRRRNPDRGPIAEARREPPYVAKARA